MDHVGVLVRWAISAIALWITTLVVPGIRVTEAPTRTRALTIVAVALIFGIVNAVLKPVIHVIGCLFYLLTLGLFALVVNALLFLLTGWIARLFGLPFEVRGFWWAVLGAAVMAVVTWLISLAVPDRVEYG
jgi:putative membrane protein